MIFFEDSNKKMFALFALSIFFVAVVFTAWIKMNPFQEVARSDGSEWDYDTEELSKSLEAMQQNFQDGFEELDDLQEEAINISQQNELLDRTKQYIENSNSNQATTTEEETN